MKTLDEMEKELRKAVDVLDLPKLPEFVDGQWVSAEYRDGRDSGAEEMQRMVDSVITAYFAALKAAEPGPGEADAKVLSI
jgi:hypothetical protein